MSVIGAALAGLAAAALILAVRSPSLVGRYLELISPDRSRGSTRWRPLSERDLWQAGIRIAPDRFVALKALACLGAVLVAAVVSLAGPIGPVLVPLAGYGGWVGPSLVVSGRAGRRRAEAERAVIVLIERLEALMAAGRPAETGLALLIGRPSGSVLLDATLARVREAYTLGAPLFRTLAYHAREDGHPACAALGDDLERARDLGTGSVAILRERRASLRAAERGRSLEAAAQVEGKLMLVLVLCHLPALLLLVVIPLFLGLLEGLFA